MSDITLAITSFALTIGAILVLIKFAPRLGLLDHPSYRKHHSVPTPAVGGLALYVMMVVLFLSGVASSENTVPLLVATTLVTLVGALDDYRHVRPRLRLLTHFIVALIMVYGAGLRLDSLGSIGPAGGYIILGPFAATVTIFGIMSVINAMNFIDGLDGLAGGLTLIAVSGLWFLFSITGQATPSLIPVMAGGLVAFLLFNARWFGRRKAALFLGDAGSTLLGMLLAWLMVEHTQGNEKVISPVVALWLLAIPLIDFLAVVIRRVMNGQHPFRPDHEHLHYVLSGATGSETWTVAVIHLFACACGAVGILGQLYNWPKNAMFYTFLALFTVTLWSLKRSWRVVRDVR
jgi:UDP-GlcNAc:undecaprenyl-phosphate GlcNAc-1-phosphate transferase